MSTRFCLRAEVICSNLGFFNYHIVETEGFAWGIWLLWKVECECAGCISTGNSCSHHGKLFCASLHPSAIYVCPYNSCKTLRENCGEILKILQIQILYLGFCWVIVTRFLIALINSESSHKYVRSLKVCWKLELLWDDWSGVFWP